MSWIWSNPPPDDESGESTHDFTTTFGTTFDSNPSDKTTTNPTTTSTESPSPDDFGTAFSDDVDITPPESELSPSYEKYLNASPTTTTGLPTMPSDPLANLDSPSINFSSMNRIDPSVLSSRPSSGQGSGLDYVFADDYQEVRKKSAGEQLTFFAGTAFLGGNIIGASRGLATAIPASAGKPLRVRVNALLNAVGKRGLSLGNACGVMALAFSLSETALYNYTGDETLFNYAASGCLAGTIYKSTRGVRVAGTWGVGGACLALATVYASRQGYYGRGLQGVL